MKGINTARACLILALKISLKYIGPLRREDASPIRQLRTRPLITAISQQQCSTIRGNQIPERDTNGVSWPDDKHFGGQ